MTLYLCMEEDRLIYQTVLATQAIANVVKSSFGPSGLDKMMVDDIGVSYIGAKIP
jgi:chaperonin GroEL (HSP60 family)